MDIEISNALAGQILANDKLLSFIPENDKAIIKRCINIGGGFGKTTIDVATYEVRHLQVLKELALASSERGLSNRLASLINLKTNPLNAKIGSLRALPAGLVTFLMGNAIKGWLFKKESDGTYQPWLVTDISYHPRRENGPDYVTIRMMANTAKGSNASTGSRVDRSASVASISIFSEDIHKSTIGEMLDKFDLIKETPELHAQYEADLSKFIEYRAKVNEQFIAVGSAVSVDDSARDYWSRNQELLKITNGHKLVNDESIIERLVIGECANPFWEPHLEGKSYNFDQVPYHCKLYFFDLTLHKHVWLHVNYVQPYQYIPELKNKLVLPESHHDLVEILASDMGYIMDDIIDGKSGGTTILCKGSPGLGKTLTAEVYSEVIKKPLYRVHSGQLGVAANNVETNLNAVLTRAARWGAVMLIDEADVFIRKRGDDIDHNAVVAAFLRTLEYFDGLLFMTTNRQDDVDDAILSRCIAVIKYELPSNEDAQKIWRVLSSQFGHALSDKLVAALSHTYSNASGRDIKELLKLTLKFCKGKDIPVDEDAFRRCAMFRGLI